MSGRFPFSHNPAVDIMARDGSAKSLPHLGDFSTDRRVLILVAMALLVGAAGTLAAWVLLRIITLTTNLVWLHTFSVQTLALAGVQRDAWMVAAPALGGLIIG